MANDFNCRNSTGKSLTLLSGSQSLAVIANGQTANNIPNSVTNVKLGGSSTVYARKQGNFVSGHTYDAKIESKDVAFHADGEPTVIFG